eukprot:COSAG03_NODE_2298_length_2905_cov_2.403421_1_plen_146_part_10
MRRNLSGQINHAASGQVHLIDPNVATRREDNLVRLDAQGRLIDSRGQRVSPSIVITLPRCTGITRGGQGMQIPLEPARNLWAEGACCALQDLPRHSKRTHSTHRQHSHAGYQYPPLGTMGGLTLLKAEGKPTTSERRRPDEGLLRG